MILQYGKIALRKRNVVGCYLAQDLPFIRYSTDVLGRARRILYFKRGTFSSKEDKIILAKVEKSGDSIETWQKLALMLKRIDQQAIRRHFETKLKGDEYFTGCWTLEEDKFILEQLFKGKKEINIEGIRASQRRNLLPAVGKLNRPICYINYHWLYKLKPILLTHYLGIDSFAWEERFANFIIEKKLDSKQKVDWKDAIEQFPEQTATSLRNSLSDWTSKKMKEDKNLPLYKAVQLHLPCLKKRKDEESSKDHRENIIRLFNEIRMG